MLRDILKHVCNSVVLDIGSGFGRHTRLIYEACSCYVVGVDVEFDKLLKAKDLCRDCIIDFICGDISRLPIRSSSVHGIVSILVLHEVEESKINDIIREVWRVLVDGASFLVIDKVLEEYRNPAEELVFLTELAYHKAIEYVYGAKLWGLRKVEELVERIVSRGFNVKYFDKIILGKWISGDEFLKHWGKKTLELLKKISNEDRRREIEGLVNKIRNTAKVYGYGPVRVVAIVFEKR